MARFRRKRFARRGRRRGFKRSFRRGKGLKGFKRYRRTKRLNFVPLSRGGYRM